MKNKWLKRISIFAGILFLLVLIANFGVNIWLKNKLPDFLKKNTDYIITYKNLNVDLGTGNIFASGISVNTKNPDDKKIIRLQGTVDTLKISRFRILNAVWFKTYSVSDIYLSKPELNITLSEPKQNSGNNEEPPFSFDNLTIENGKITVYNNARQKVFSTAHLNIVLKGFKQENNDAEFALPFHFDDLRLDSDSLFYLSKQQNLLSARKISTKNKDLTIEDLQWKSLLSLEEFRKRFPEKTDRIYFSAQHLELSGISIKKNKLSFSGIKLNTPNIKIQKTGTTFRHQKKNPFPELKIGNLQVQNMAFQRLNTDGSPDLSFENLQCSVKDLLYNDETSSEVLLVRYSDFNINGNNSGITFGGKNFHLGSLQIRPKTIEFKDLSEVSDAKIPLVFSVKKGFAEFNLAKNKENKYFFDVRQIAVNGLKGIWKTNTTNKKPNNFENFPSFQIGKLSLSDSDITFDDGKQPIDFHNLNASANQLRIQKKSKGKGLDFSVEEYTMSTKKLNYKTKFYQISLDALKLTDKTMEALSFKMIPLVTRKQFTKMIPVEQDLYTLQTGRISTSGKWTLFSSQKMVHASQITVESANVNIFRSKIPKDDTKIKPMYSEMLRRINFPLFVDHLFIKNSILEYEEDTPKSNGPGKLVFSDFNLHAKNLNSEKMKGKPTEIPITIHCRFMNVSPMQVLWTMNTARTDDYFTISGSISDLPAPSINPFIEPYLKIRATGTVQKLVFDFKGNKSSIGGTMNIKHQNLKINILKNDGEKNKFLSAVANIFVKSNSGKFPETTTVQNVKRDPTRSFFNLFWRAIEDGLKQTLTGIGKRKKK